MVLVRSISLQEGIALARSGDADAQYALSAMLHERGQFDESLQWLRQAAAKGLVPARLTLATILLDGRHCARDQQQAIDLLKPLAATQVQANLLLSELHGFAALGGLGRETGLRYLFDAARMGDAGALRQFALLCAFHNRSELLRPLLDASAKRGDAAAAYALASCYAEGFGGDPHPRLAVNVAESEAVRGQYLGPSLYERVQKHRGGSSPATPPLPEIEWGLLNQALSQLAGEVSVPAAEVLHEAPLVRRLGGAIHPLVLDAVTNLAAPLVKRSQVIDARTGEVRVDPMRTSSHVTLGARQHDHVLEALERCISSITGLPPENAEFLQILRYRLNEEFRPHVDYFNEGGAGAYQSFADGGQRAQTVLIYLNEGYSGGHTSFLKLGLNIRGHRGDVLHFHNIGADNLGYRDSLHSGAPVTAGEKWLLSQWIRNERYAVRDAWQ